MFRCQACGKVSLPHERPVIADVVRRRVVYQPHGSQGYETRLALVMHARCAPTQPAFFLDNPPIIRYDSTIRHHTMKGGETT